MTHTFAPIHLTETFTYMCRSYDVTAAWRLVAGWTTEERDARLIKLPLPLNTLDTIVIDANRAASADLDVPLIVVQFANGGRLVIDGWARVCKAADKKKRTLPAFLLTLAETCEIESTQKKPRKQG